MGILNRHLRLALGCHSVPTLCFVALTIFAIRGAHAQNAFAAPSNAFPTIVNAATLPISDEVLAVRAKLGVALVKLETAAKAYQERRFEDALLSFDEAQKLFQQAKNPIGESDALRGRGEAEYILGRNEEARASFDQARELCAKAAYPLGEARALRGLADVERVTGRNDEARRAFERAVTLFQSLGNRQGEAEALKGFGELDRKLGRNAEARASYERAQSLFRQLKMGQGEAHTWVGLAEIDRKQGRSPEARTSYERALLLYRSDHEQLGEANAMTGLGMLENDLSRYPEAQTAFDRARDLYHTIPNPLGEGNAWLGLGEVRRKLGLENDARIAYRTARTLFQSVKNQAGEANVLRGIGYLEAELERYDEARRAYTDAQEFANRAGDKSGAAEALTGLGDLDRKLKRYPEARGSYDQALLLSRDEQYQLVAGNASLGIGHLEAAQNRHDEARKYFKNASIAFGLAGTEHEQRMAIDLAVPGASERLYPQFWSWRELAWPSSAIILGFVGLMVFRHRARQKPTTAQVSPESGKRWFCYQKDCPNAVVFVHGILSGPSGFRFSQTVSWPQILSDDPRAKGPNIFLAQYYTAPDAGPYAVWDASEELLVQLRLRPEDGSAAPIECERIVFVAHSTGGLVVKDLLTRHTGKFRGKTIGLALVASPSRGSEWANRLNLLIDLANNKMAKQLQKGNEWTMGLDKTFFGLITQPYEERGFDIKGVDLFENRFVVGNIGLLRWLIPTRMVVVSAETSGSYFGPPKIVPNTTHFSIAKPDGPKHDSHEYLMSWWVIDCKW